MAVRRPAARGRHDEHRQRVWLSGQVSAKIARLTVTYGDGAVDTVRPVAGLIAYPLRPSKLADGSALSRSAGYAQDGSRVAERGLTVQR